MRPIRLCFVSALVAIVGIGVFSGDRSDRPEIILPGNSTETMRFALPERADMLEARFALCGDRIRVNCVIDGDTFWFNGKKIRIADIDAPEIASPHCRDEKHMGEMARDHLLVLLNAGGFTLVTGRRDADRYGRKLRTVTRNGHSLGETLVEDGLARRWNGPKRDWCRPD